MAGEIETSRSQVARAWTSIGRCRLHRRWHLRVSARTPPWRHDLLPTTISGGAPKQGLRGCAQKSDTLAPNSDPEADYGKPDLEVVSLLRYWIAASMRPNDAQRSRGQTVSPVCQGEARLAFPLSNGQFLGAENKRDDNPFRRPIGRQPDAQLAGHAAVEQLASVTVASRRLHLRSTAFGPGDMNLVIDGRPGNIQHARAATEGAVFERIGGQFVDDQGQGGSRLFTNSHARHGNTNAATEGTGIVVGRQQNREKIAQQCRTSLMAWQRPNKIVRPTQRSEPVRQFLRHFLDGGRGPRRQIGQTCGNGQEVLHPVAHFAREQFVAFFGLLSSRYVEKHPRHPAAVKPFVVSETPC